MEDGQTWYVGERARYGANPPHRILVVDDDNLIRQLCTEVLSHAGFSVNSSADGAAAWQVLASNSYDLLITDNYMPKVTGVELLKKLRDAQMVLPVVMISGATALEDSGDGQRIAPVFSQHPDKSIILRIACLQHVGDELDGIGA